MALDTWQARNVAQLRQGHLELVAVLAAQAEEYGRLIAKGAREGKPFRFVGDLESRAQGIAEAVAAIRAIDQILEINSAGDGS
jgi:hypothetical protein